MVNILDFLDSTDSDDVKMLLSFLSSRGLIRIEDLDELDSTLEEWSELMSESE